MAKVNAILCFVMFLLCIVFSSCSRLSFNGQKQVAQWCVAQIKAPAAALQGFLDFACSKYDCSQINPGGSCYNPNTLANHASYALDLNFRKTGQCPSNIATPAVTDPSFGGCHYP